MSVTKSVSALLKERQTLPSDHACGCNDAAETARRCAGRRTDLAPPPASLLLQSDDGRNRRRPSRRHFAFELKSSSGAGETRQRFGDLCRTARPTQNRLRSPPGRCKRCAARARANDVADHIRPMPDGEDSIQSLVVTNVVRRDVGLRAQSISDSPAFNCAE